MKLTHKTKLFFIALVALMSAVVAATIRTTWFHHIGGGVSEKALGFGMVVLALAIFFYVQNTQKS